MNCRIRTSSGAFLKRGQDDAIQHIEAKIAKLSGIPAENGEGLQILNYEASEKYEAHFDYFHDQSNQLDGGQRLATMLMYLSDVEEGGETVFPASRQKPVRPYAAYPRVSPLVQPQCMAGCHELLRWMKATPDGHADVNLPCGSSTSWLKQAFSVP